MPCIWFLKSETKKLSASTYWDRSTLRRWYRSTGKIGKDKIIKMKVDVCTVLQLPLVQLRVQFMTRNAVEIGKPAWEMPTSQQPWQLVYIYAPVLQHLAVSCTLCFVLVWHWHQAWGEFALAVQQRSSESFKSSLPFLYFRVLCNNIVKTPTSARVGSYRSCSYFTVRFMAFLKLLKLLGLSPEPMPTFIILAEGPKLNRARAVWWFTIDCTVSKTRKSWKI